MGLREDMERQRAALEAEAKRAQDVEARRRQESEDHRQFCCDFVKEANARGMPSAPIPGYYNGKPKASQTKGWIVYVDWQGRCEYAIGIDGQLYEPAITHKRFANKEPSPVRESDYLQVPWQHFTNVLLGKPPAQCESPDRF